MNNKELRHVTRDEMLAALKIAHQTLLTLSIDSDVSISRQKLIGCDLELIYNTIRKEEGNPS